MDYEIKKNSPRVEGVPVEAIEQTQTAPSPYSVAEIVQVAMEQYKEGYTVAAVFIAPSAYPHLVDQIGRTVQFPELYGFVSFDVYGLQFFVKRFPQGEDVQEWSEDYWYEIVPNEHADDLYRPLDTLMAKVVHTWESCNTQCEQGFPCPLLVEVGSNLEGEVLQACTALRDIETLMAANEPALDAARAKFYDELSENADDEPMSENADNEPNEEQQDGSGSSNPPA